MTSCTICKKAVPTTFLEKPLGTFVKDKKGKQHLVCSECQQKLGTKAEILKNLS